MKGFAVFATQSLPVVIGHYEARKLAVAIIEQAMGIPGGAYVDSRGFLCGAFSNLAPDGPVRVATEADKAAVVVARRVAEANLDLPFPSFRVMTDGEIAQALNGG